MRIALPLAATRVRTFPRVFGSSAQTALNAVAHEGQDSSRPTDAAGTGTDAPHAQRTEPAGSLTSSSAMCVSDPTLHVDLVPSLGLRVILQELLLQVLERLLGAVAHLEEV